MGGQEDRVPDTRFAEMREYESREEMDATIPADAPLLGKIEFRDVGDQLACAVEMDGLDPATLGRLLIDMGQRMLGGVAGQN